LASIGSGKVAMVTSFNSSGLASDIVPLRRSVFVRYLKSMD
jgi:hypothetical protein